MKGEAGRRQGEGGLQQGDIEEENQAACEEESDPLGAIEHSLLQYFIACLLSVSIFKEGHRADS